jgi:hypothetical protein
MFIQVVTIGHVLDDIAELPHDRNLWGEVAINAFGVVLIPDLMP